MKKTQTPEFKVIDYTDKFILVLGATRPLRKQFLQIGGVWKSVCSLADKGFKFKRELKSQVEEIILNYMIELENPPKNPIIQRHIDSCNKGAVSFTAEKQIVDWLHKQAHTQNVSVSQICRDIMSNYIGYMEHLSKLGVRAKSFKHTLQSDAGDAFVKDGGETTQSNTKYTCKVCNGEIPEARAKGALQYKKTPTYCSNKCYNVGHNLLKKEK
jgi:hypothetical protein